MSRVAVIMGGRSSEREISLKTGAQILAALGRLGHEAKSFDLSNSLMSELAEWGPDVAFIALHGRYGEDGCIQGLLEIMNIPYVGSGVLASAIAIDKGVTKKLLASAGIRVPGGVSIDRKSYMGQSPEEKREFEEFVIKEIGLPAVVKPSKQGSTIGLTFVRESGELARAIELAFEYDNEAIIEEYIEGTEVTVGVLGNEEATALPVLEIVAKTGRYDYETKYTQGLSEHIIPARIPEEAERVCRDYAERAHKILGCRGLSRTDMIVTKDGPIVLEVNTIPGMTETSLFPDAARSVGIDFDSLIQRLLDLAFQ